jgi:SAM-dependent methyltransferase
VACGGGLVGCAFAPKVRQVTGIDATPAMLARARALAQAKGITNASWHLGDALALPFADASFDIVTTRFSFHHFLQPLAVLREMVRVCAPGGRVLVVDVVASEDPSKAQQFNRMELLRDPSHVRNLTAQEIRDLFVAVELEAADEVDHELRDLLDNLLARSFPNGGDEQKIRDIYAAALFDDGLGIPLRKAGAAIEYAYPVKMFRARKA